MRFAAGLALSAALSLSSVMAADAPSYGARLDAAIATAAGEAGGDPAKALAFVTGATSYEPYQGALRGARGAYATGRGNSVDRALLLQAVLKPAASRFAQCTLGEAEAAKLAETTLPARPPLAIERAGELAGQAEPGSVKDYLTALAASWQQLTAIQKEESAALAQIVATAGIGFAGTDAALVRRGAAAEHVWLQVQKDGAWVDLDPAATGPGVTLCTPSATFDVLPENLRHRVAVDVVLEVRKDGASEMRTLLHHEADAADLAFDDTLVFFAEAQGLMTEAEAAATASGAFAYTPVLRVGATDVTGTAFLAAAPASGFVGQTAAEQVGGATDLIGGLPTEPEPTTPPEPPKADLAEEPAAAFLEITLLSPGVEPVRAGGLIFDRRGAAARLKGDNTAPLKDLVETDGDYAELTKIWAVGVLSGEIVQRDKRDPQALVRGDAFAQAAGLAGALRGFENIEAALLRTSGLAPITTHTRPRLLLVGLGTTGVGEAGRVSLAADLVASGVEDAPAASEGAEARAARAVARVLAERAVTGLAGLPVPGLKDAARPVADADLLSLSAAARAAGNAFGTGPAAFEDADANALAAAHVGDGHVVLLPSGSVDVNGVKSAGWWVADLKAGLLYDEIGNGRSSTSGETAGQLERTREQIPAWRRFACGLSKFAMGASLAIGMATFLVDPSAGGNQMLTLAEEIHAAEQAAEKAAQEAAASGGGGNGGCGPIP